MVEAGAVDTSGWTTKGLQALDGIINEAHEARKYAFIWDKQGNVSRFL